MYVAHIVQADIKNKTMTIPSSVLKPPNADIDGDVLNIFRLIGQHFGNEFAKCMDPCYNLFISRLDGNINPECMPFKDEATIFYQFNNI